MDAFAPAWVAQRVVVAVGHGTVAVGVAAVGEPVAAIAEVPTAAEEEADEIDHPEG